MNLLYYLFRNDMFRLLSKCTHATKNKKVPFELHCTGTRKKKHFFLCGRDMKDSPDHISWASSALVSDALC